MDFSKIDYTVLTYLNNPQYSATLHLYTLNNPKVCFKEYRYSGSNSIEFDVQLGETYGINLVTNGCEYLGYISFSADAKNKISYDLYFTKHEYVSNNEYVFIDPNNPMSIMNSYNKNDKTNYYIINKSETESSFVFIPNYTGYFSLTAISNSENDVQTFHERAVLCLRIADHNVVIRDKKDIRDLAFRRERFSAAGSAEY